MQPFPVQSKISLSFLTKRMASPEDDVFLGTGFILWPEGLIKQYSSRSLFGLRFTCAFPTDGGTGYELLLRYQHTKLTSQEGITNR